MPSVPNKEIRRVILEMAHNSGASHIGTALSAVEILNAVFGNVDLGKIKKHDSARDRVILSKGHGVAALYAVMHHRGLLSAEDINSYLKNGSFFAGHVSFYVPFVEHSTGALGHGLPVGLGMAIGLRSKKCGARVFVVTGDAELQEGSNWEAFMLAGNLGIGKLCVLVDNNGLDQMGKTADTCDVEPLASKLESFKFAVYTVEDGHDEAEISKIIKATANSKKPVAIICRTIKGKGISFMENNVLWHYRCPQGEDYEKALAELK